jgi:hypothetical protein
MLTLFENITEELTPLEKQTLVTMLLEKLKYSTIENPVKGKHIVGWFSASGYKTTDVRLRKMVSYIRQCCILKDAVLCASSKGYYISKDLAEIDNQIESIEGRRNQLNNVIEGLKAQRENIKHFNKKIC